MAIKNKYQIERNYVTNRLARGRSKNNGIRFLVAHETANNNTGADGHYNYFQNITSQVSAHTLIDAKKILEIIPLDEKAWHVQYQNLVDNRMFGADANDAAIGVELCRPGDFEKAYDRYVWYFAYLCKKFGLKPKSHIVAHSTLDPQRRVDPESWLHPNGVTWNQFINDVQRYFDDWEEEGTSTPKPSQPSKPSIPSKPKDSNYTGDSIVDYLNSVSVDSSFNNRTKLAVQYGIKNYTGTASQNTELLNKMRNDEPKKSTYAGDSIVDYLNSIGIDSSFSNRGKLAKQHGISNYKGTSAQNTQLLNKLRVGNKMAEKGDQNTTSIIDYLNSIGVDSSFANRKKLAVKHGIKNYRGTAGQNSQLLKKLRG